MLMTAGRGRPADTMAATVAELDRDYLLHGQAYRECAAKADLPGLTEVQDIQADLDLIIARIPLAAANSSFSGKID